MNYLLWMATVTPIGIMWIIPWSDAEGTPNWWVLIPKALCLPVSIIAFEYAMLLAREKRKQEAIKERGVK